MSTSHASIYVAFASHMVYGLEEIHFVQIPKSCGIHVQTLVRVSNNLLLGMMRVTIIEIDEYIAQLKLLPLSSTMLQSTVSSLLEQVELTDTKQ